MRGELGEERKRSANAINELEILREWRVGLDEELEAARAKVTELEQDNQSLKDILQS